jgi:hypothetical protein
MSVNLTILNVTPVFLLVSAKCDCNTCPGTYLLIPADGYSKVVTVGDVATISDFDLVSQIKLNNFIDIKEELSEYVIDVVKASHGKLLDEANLQKLIDVNIVHYHNSFYSGDEQKTINSHMTITEFGLERLIEDLTTPLSPTVILTVEPLDKSSGWAFFNEILDEIIDEITPADMKLMNEEFGFGDTPEQPWVEDINGTLYLSSYGVHMSRGIITEFESGITTMTGAVSLFSEKGIDVISCDDDSFILIPTAKADAVVYPCTVTSF